MAAVAVAQVQAPLMAQPYASDSASPADAEYYRLFSARNAKLLAVVAMLAVGVYHAAIRALFGSQSCSGMFDDGRYQGELVWQPYGCMLHLYSETDARLCMQAMTRRAENRMVFVGSRRVRHVYMAFVDLLSTQARAQAVTSSHLYFDEAKLNLSVVYYEHERVDRALVDRVAMLASGALGNVSLMVIDGGLSSALANVSAQTAREFGRNVSYLLPYLHQLRDNTAILWMLQANVDEQRLVLRANKSAASCNRQISRLNSEVEAVLQYSAVRIWRSAAALSDGYLGDSVDGVLPGDTAVHYDVQILLNFYCNDAQHLADGTCCSRAERRTHTQTILFGAFALCVGVTCLLAAARCRSPLRRLSAAAPIDAGVVLSAAASPAHRSGGGRSRGGTSRTPSTSGNPLSVLLAVSKLCLLMLFFYGCDRANWFMKENRWFTYFNYFLPICYLTVLGVFFNEEAKSSLLMNREQTDEWKGWMQLALLSYHMTGAQQVRWIYMITRCLFSAYLFLLGFSHFTYFWSTRDFSLKRFCRVLFRYNLVCVLLCLTMNRHYQFYDYVPLISFWFLVCYLVMAIPPQVSASTAQQNPFHYAVVGFKLICLLGLNAMLYLSEVFFNEVFGAAPWRAVFATDGGDMSLWWRRWSRDRFIVVAGMAFALVASLLRHLHVMTEERAVSLFSARLSVLLSAAAALGVATYGLVVSRCRSAAECDEFHAYISWLPVLSYVLLRNVVGCARGRVSRFFAWFGRISLELFAVQRHGWLAADGHGVLVLLPRWPVFNMILSSFVCGCAAHQLRAVTLQLLPALLPDSDARALVRNLALLALAAALFVWLRAAA